MAQEKESQLKKQSSEYEGNSNIEIPSGVRTAKTPQRNHNVGKDGKAQNIRGYG
jgi:hypothetical protein